MDEVLQVVRSFEGVLELAPGEGSEFPEIAWGDHFFYFAPDGQIPENLQPYATIVTKDYPGDRESELDGPGRWRVNVRIGRARFTDLIGEDRDVEDRDVTERNFSTPDAILPHPVYGSLGWIAVVNPGERTAGTILELLRAAHDDARRRTDGRPQPRS